MSFPGKHISGGQVVAGVSDLIDCLAACQARIAICQGVDFDFSINMCFIHNATTECTTLQPKEKCNHFRTVDCCMYEFVLNSVMSQ